MKTIRALVALVLACACSYGQKVHGVVLPPGTTLDATSASVTKPLVEVTTVPSGACTDKGALRLYQLAGAPEVWACTPSSGSACPCAWTKSSGSAGGGTWGSITGTLSSQTDLQTALGGKAPSTSGTSILKGNGSGGFSNAVSATDYAPATSGSAILKGNGSGGFSSAVSATDYAPATSGSALLKGNGAGGFSAAVANTDYPAVTHATRHQNGGADEVGTATPAANAIPKAGAGGQLAAGWQPALTGDVTTTAGSVATTAVKVNGVSYPSAPSTDSVPVITAANTALYKILPDCDNPTTSKLLYDQTTHAFSCGTDQNSGGPGGGLAADGVTIIDTAGVGSVNTAVMQAVNTVTLSSGSGTTFVGTMTPPITAYADKMMVRWTPNQPCSGSPTLNLHTLGAKPIYERDGTTAVACASGMPYQLVYDVAVNGAAGGWRNLAVASNTSTAWYLSGSGAPTNVNASSQTWVMPLAGMPSLSSLGGGGARVTKIMKTGTLQNAGFALAAATTQPGTGDLVCTVEISANGSTGWTATAIQRTVTAGTTTASNTIAEYTDSTHTASVTAGQFGRWSCANAATTASASITAMWGEVQ